MPCPAFDHDGVECARGDLVEYCVDQVEEGFNQYLQHNNGNPLVYDTVRSTCYAGVYFPAGP